MINFLSVLFWDFNNGDEVMRGNLHIRFGKFSYDVYNVDDVKVDTMGDTSVVVFQKRGERREFVFDRPVKVNKNGGDILIEVRND